MIRSAIYSLLLTVSIAEANTRGVPFSSKVHRPAWTSTSKKTSSTSTELNVALFPRGGDAAAADGTTAVGMEEQSLDDRVNAAMRRLGLGDDVDGNSDAAVAESSEEEATSAAEGTMNCEGGVCTIEPSSEDSTISVNNDDDISPTETTTTTTNAEEVVGEEESYDDQDIYAVADRISKDMSVPQDIAMAAISASLSGEGDDRRINESAARSIVQAEVDAIQNVPEDCDEVKQLVSEGFDTFLSRRSLAFTEMNLDDARAILIADQEDEEAERQQIEEQQKQQAAAIAAAKKQEEEETAKLTHKTVTVNSNFDPLASMAAATPPAPKPQTPKKPEGMPNPAKKEDVIFEGTTEDLQKLVIESPVPVLLDVYADWCGPCKQLTPALEQICINAGGMLRLVKINTDQQRQISSALEVKALPTIFGIKDGKILNIFQGMPRDETFLRNFLMGLMVPGQKFNPPVTAEEKANYDDLSAKLLKLAAGASFSFSARERLQNKIAKDLDELVGMIGGETGMAVADDTARILRSLMSNVIKDPFEKKFRKINLGNKVLAAKVAQYAPCISLLKSIGFVQEDETTMEVAKGKKIVNIAPFVVGRDCIDKWIDKNRYQIAAAARKRKDEIERARLAAEAEEAAKNGVDEEDEEEDEEDVVDPNLCTIKLRMEGKKKVHDLMMDANDTLNTLLEKLPFPVADGETVQFTCAARRLIVKSTDEASMGKTLSELKLMPAASVVVKIGERKAAEVVSGSLAERASSKKKKTGSHSMHSIGLYSTQDGSKAELIDGGSGVLWEHDVTDDEEEEAEESRDDNNENAAEAEAGEGEDDNSTEDIVVTDDDE